MTKDQILDAKVEILRLLADGLAKNITDAARQLGLRPARVYDWARNDKDFHALMDACYEVMADDIEKGFIEGKNDIPKMMLLKGRRPIYRDNYKVDFNVEKIESFLKELKEIGQRPAQVKGEE